MAALSLVGRGLGVRVLNASGGGGFWLRRRRLRFARRSWGAGHQLEAPAPQRQFRFPLAIEQQRR